MNNFKYALASTLFMISIHSHATVGGGQSIEVLGYEAKEQKLYVLRHFGDERGRLPQLYYYQLNSKTPDKLIEVKSLYINPKTKQIDYDQDGIQFEKDLKKIEKRLTPMSVGNANTAKIQVLNNQTQKVPAWHDPSEKIPQYTTSYKVQSGNLQNQNLQSNSLQSKTQTAIHYDNKLKITQEFVIPKHNKMLVVIQYFGIPMETGYDIEDPVLLLPKK